jgi:hypothetical protein
MSSVAAADERFGRSVVRSFRSILARGRRSQARRQARGHANLGTTSIYLQGIDPEEIIAIVHMRRAPMMSASAGLRLLTETANPSGSATARSRCAMAKRASGRDGQDEWSSSRAGAKELAAGALARA